MNLKNIIIHSIQRNAAGAQITKTIKAAENQVSGSIISLFQQLKNTFNRSSQKIYGHFDSELSDNPLPQWMKDHLKGSSTFQSMSQRIIDLLIDKLDTTEEPLDAHLIVGLETIEETSCLYLFWVAHTDALQVSYQLDIEPIQYIDTARLPYAMRVNLTEWHAAESKKYLTIVASRGDKYLADAFINYCAFKEGLDTASDTHEFLTIVDEFTHSLPEEKVNEYKAKIITYCVEQDRQGQPVVIKDISGQLDERQPEKFSHFVNEKQNEPRPEFHPHRSSLKRYIRFFGRDRSMSISFSADVFGQGIRYDEKNDSLIIEQIPKSLKEQLLKHIEKAG